MEPAVTDDPAVTIALGDRYRRFAEAEAAHHSEVYAAWAQGVAGDAEIEAMIATLPQRERQPNLLFTAARYVDPDLVAPDQRSARRDEYSRFRTSLLDHWAELRQVTARYHTQTNEVGRMAVVLPLVDKVAQSCGKPVALIEFGASAGLLLNPEQFGIDYVDRAGSTLTSVRHHDLDEPVQIITLINKGTTRCPQSFPQIDWRLGVDLRPLNPLRAADIAWLRALIWPGQTHRLARLDAALVAAKRRPVRVIQRDITHPNVLDEVLRLVPADCEPVIMHSAVLAYLDDDQRHTFAERMLRAVADHQCHWISNEGQQVVPQITAAMSPAFAESLRRGSFVVSLDGVPQYQADGHAAWIL